MDELDKKRKRIINLNSEINNLGKKDFEKLSNNEIAQMKSCYQFEKQLEDALNINVPSSLAEKIILKHQINNNNQTSYVKPFLSFAASVVLLLTWLIVTLPKEKLADLALTHIYHELDHLIDEKKLINRNKAKNDINQLGFNLPQLPTKIYYAGQCLLGKKKAMHIVAEINNNAVTLLISQEQVEKKILFKDSRFEGSIYPIKNGSVILIGESIKDVNQLYLQLGAI